jgi:hypothetical protein
MPFSFWVARKKTQDVAFTARDADTLPTPLPAWHNFIQDLTLRILLVPLHSYPQVMEEEMQTRRGFVGLFSARENALRRLKFCFVPGEFLNVLGETGTLPSKVLEANLSLFGKFRVPEVRIVLVVNSISSRQKMADADWGSSEARQYMNQFEREMMMPRQD